MKMKKLLLGAAAAMLVCAMAASPAGAYFTDDDEAAGTKGYSYEVQTTMTEHVGEYKQITIANTGDVYAVKVRARAFAPAPYDQDMVYTGTDWESAADGWYYYDTDVQPGESTAELDIDPNLPEASASGQNINIIVVYEAIPANTEWEAAE